MKRPLFYPWRLILRAERGEDLDAAFSAAKWLSKQPASQKDAILAYGGIHVYVKRNKDSITATALKDGG